MAKKKDFVFVCNNCGNEFSKWSGQCAICGEWNSLKEVKGRFDKKEKRVIRKEKVEVKNLGKLKDKKGKNKSVFSSNISEFDRVLGKGIVQGGVVLFAGEPGIGKSTLLTQLIGKIGGLYIAGEESAEQIALRVKRLALKMENFDIFESNSIEEIEDYLGRVKDLHKIVVVGSVQVMSCENMNGGMGSVAQIKEVTFRLIRLAKKMGVAMFIVGHVTKEGDIAGPKILEHMVDTVLYFEGEKNGDLRILRNNKNRFGSTDEVGVFKMEESGLREVRSEEIKLINSKRARIGSAVTIIMEGSRPMILEIEALVTESFGAMPKRVFAGIDYNRGQLLIAIAQKNLNIPLYKYDVFISVTGGIKIDDTGVDMAVLAAMWSSYKEKVLDNKIIWVGEVSLLGEVKKVKNWEKRGREAKSMGRELVKMANVRELKNR